MKMIVDKESDWYLTIIRTGNGYYLEGGDGLRLCIEEGDDPLHEHEALLQHVINHFGFSGTKHDSERLCVTRRRKDEDY